MNSPLYSRVFRFLLLLVSLIGFLYAGFFTWRYLAPFIIALFISWSVQPFVNLLHVRFHLPRSLASLFILVLLGSLIVSLILLVIVEAINGIQVIGKDIPIKVEKLVSHVIEQLASILIQATRGLETWLNSLELSNHFSLEDTLSLIQIKISELSSAFIDSLFGALSTGLASLPMSMTSIIVAALATFFFTKDWDKLHSVWNTLTPDFFRDTAGLIPKQVKETMAGVVKAQAILVLISSLLIWVGLSILGIEHTLSITMVAAVVDVIPYIGTGVIFIPWALFEFFQGNFPLTIGLCILYMIVVLTRQVLEPKLLASHFGVHPVFLLMGLFLGFQLLGVYGMVLSPFIIVCIKTLHSSGVFHLAIDFIMGRTRI
ncbi:sporulation integral membrane protein YtvI [Halobacillus salinus]|uniref:Sporulation integral membrane protein YtvI n=1 Tax=Halobacillus salinus TaxID=192814 RepID=A0A4Z0H298_9BACI|nr:sporulation integral membrane protein YtvI [Halobacillus salinus]TGB04079.1 sporulation integral membrane protein YtvI [Halobacillus salinus]